MARRREESCAHGIQEREVCLSEQIGSHHQRHLLGPEIDTILSIVVILDLGDFVDPVIVRSLCAAKNVDNPLLSDRKLNRHSLIRSSDT